MGYELENLDQFLQEWHPDYSGANVILQIDLLEQYTGKLNDEARTKDDMYQSDLNWIRNLTDTPEDYLEILRRTAFDEAIIEWAKDQLDEKIDEFKLKYKIK